jgi:hypothetical protein
MQVQPNFYLSGADAVIDRLARNQHAPQPLQPLPASTVVQHRQMVRYPRTTCFTGQFHYSKIPLSELKPITLNEMFAPYQHHGFFLLCRIAKVVAQGVGVTLYIEDLNGLYTTMCLYYVWPGHNCTIHPEKYVPEGTILIVKEPWAEMIGNGHARIEVETPTDLIFVDEDDDSILGQTRWLRKSQ